MASRGKKKTQARGATPVSAEVVTRKRDNRWAYVVAAALVLLTVFLFINSFTVQANIEYTDENGDNLLEDIDQSQMTFGKSAVTAIFAPVDGYEDAIDYTLRNLPFTKDSTIVQDIAKQLVSAYPQEKLQLLDTAYITIYVTETIYLALTLAFAAFSIVALVRKKEGDDVLSLIAAAVMTVLSAARLIIGLAMCMNSTKEFMITAGGAPWLALVTTLAATVILAVIVRGRKKEESNKEAKK